MLQDGLAGHESKNRKSCQRGMRKSLKLHVRPKVAKEAKETVGRFGTKTKWIRNNKTAMCGWKWHIIHNMKYITATIWSWIISSIHDLEGGCHSCRLQSAVGRHQSGLCTSNKTAKLFYGHVRWLFGIVWAPSWSRMSGLRLCMSPLEEVRDMAAPRFSTTSSHKAAYMGL